MVEPHFHGLYSSLELCCSCNSNGKSCLDKSSAFSVQLFLCPPLHHPLSRAPCRMVFDTVSWRVKRPNYGSFLLSTVAGRSSRGPASVATYSRTESLVLCSVHEMPRSLRKHGLTRRPDSPSPLSPPSESSFRIREEPGRED